MKKNILGSIFSFVLLINIIPLDLAAAELYRINNGSGTGWFEAVDGKRTRITNNSGKHIFVPNKSSAEMSAFKSHRPSGVSYEHDSDRDGVGDNSDCSPNNASFTTRYSGFGCGDCPFGSHVHPTVSYAAVCAGSDRGSTGPGCGYESDSLGRWVEGDWSACW